jgi:hypothetical protein
MSCSTDIRDIWRIADRSRVLLDPPPGTAIADAARAVAWEFNVDDKMAGLVFNGVILRVNYDLAGDGEKVAADLVRQYHDYCALCDQCGNDQCRA